jgi:hypothetical protein
VVTSAAARAVGSTGVPARRKAARPVGGDGEADGRDEGADRPPAPMRAEPVERRHAIEREGEDQHRRIDDRRPGKTVRALLDHRPIMTRKRRLL